MANDLLTLDEVAAMLRVSRKTLLNWRARGTAPTGFRLGRAVVFDRTAVEQYIDSHRVGDRVGARTRGVA